MNLKLAFNYMFQDPRWTEKLVILAGFALFNIVPIFGLVATALLLGYMVDLTANVIKDTKHALPRWLRLDEKIGHGASVLAAIIIYNMPLILVGGCVATVPALFRDELTAGSVSLLMILCFTPLVLGYTFVAWSMLALGFIRFTQSEDTNDLYRFSKLYGEFRARLPLVVQWATLATIVNVIMGLLLFIPCLGWLAIMALMVPVQGHLLGQFARQLGIKPRVKTDK